ncbi:MAG: helix-turn-helix domain containing protein [Oscillospiraceae bacterium]|nr:helix-turn-helix domain containing protein [Oscillospiraceae bacterium]
MLTLKSEGFTAQYYKRGYTVDELCEFHDFAYSEEQIQRWINEYEASLIKF